MGGTRSLKRSMAQVREVIDSIFVCEPVSNPGSTAETFANETGMSRFPFAQTPAVGAHDHVALQIVSFGGE